MSRTGIYRTSDGQLLSVHPSDSFNVAREDMTGCATVDVPDDWPEDQDWDAASAGFVANLAGWRAARSIEATAYRDQRINAGCTTSLGVVDADDVSRTNILGAVSMAMIAKGAAAAYSIEWRLHDNSYKTLDADQMMQLGVEVGQFINACYQASFAAKNAIDAAADHAAIDAVDVTAGYPA